MALNAAKEKREVLVLLTSSPEISHDLNSHRTKLSTWESFRVSDVHTTFQWTKYADSVQAQAVTFFNISHAIGGVVLS